MQQDDCPPCFARYQRCCDQRQCDQCEFAESCKFCTENDTKDHHSGNVSYEQISYSEKVAAKPVLPELAPDANDSEVLQVMEYLLDIDNYTAELASAVLHSNCNSCSDLGRKLGISRQAVHRKLVDCCTEHPELRKLFVTRLNRCRRLLTDSRRLSTKHNPNQMEFNF